MDNESNSIVKRSLVLTAKLVGGFALWITVLSVVLVSVTGRVVSALAGAPATTASAEETIKSKTPNGASRTLKASPPANPDKSNG